MKSCFVYSDGGARGNPGPAAGAAVVFADVEGAPGELVGEAWQTFTHATNNVAEYTGIIVGLQKAKELGYTHVQCRLDSELAVKQLNGQYKVKNPELGKLFLQVHNLKMQFAQVSFTHVRREQNTAADALVNRAIDGIL
jgi:ribonuclease HI